MIPKRIFWLLDILAMLAAACLAEALLRSAEPFFNEGGLLHSHWLQSLRPPSKVYWSYAGSQTYAWLVLGLIPPVLLCLNLAGNYANLLKQSLARIILGCLSAPLAGLCLVSLTLFLLKAPPLSRFILFFYALSSGVLLCAWRLSLRSFYRVREKQGRCAMNILVVGRKEAVRRVAHLLAEPGLHLRYRPIGYLSEGDGNGSLERNRMKAFLAVGAGPGSHRHSVDVLDAPSPQPGAQALDLERLGGFGDLRHLLNNHPIHEVVVVLPSTEADWALDAIDACDELGVTLRVVPESLLFHTRKALRASRLEEDLPLPGVLLRPTHYKPEALFLKRCLDVVGGTLLLMLAAPVMALVALVIKASEPRAPVLYSLWVVGQNGVRCRILKFRTMLPEADKLKDELLSRNEMNGPVFKIRNDPRITPVGRFLRKFSLDELPQLLNVVRGDLSLVGPRAPMPSEVQRYDFWHKRRLSIKPGLTCLWQIRGRNKVCDFEDWVNMDLEYIDNWSLWLDFKILLLTIPAVLKGTGQ
jgi:exopolysaccharide biosynthesis polyprenyl glycosylphosphotransferase